MFRRVTLIVDSRQSFQKGGTLPMAARRSTGAIF
jgi:hypothetical protein